MIDDKLVTAIDDLLPQTQCGLCGFGGCRPYAEAIVRQNAGIDLCPPGGISTLVDLANLLSQDPKPYFDTMKLKEKPPSRAVIREAECIGCTKCIQVCPVDAILGAAKQMHTVIGEECTGCELCIEPCPVDCIDMLPMEKPSKSEQKRKSEQAKQRYLNRNRRLQTANIYELPSIKPIAVEGIDIRKKAIQEAMARVKAKKGKQNDT